VGRCEQWSAEAIPKPRDCFVPAGMTVFGRQELKSQLVAEATLDLLRKLHDCCGALAQFGAPSPTTNKRRA